MVVPSPPTCLSHTYTPLPHLPPCRLSPLILSSATHIYLSLATPLHGSTPLSLRQQMHSHPYFSIKATHPVPLAHLLIRPSPSQLLRTLPSAALPHATIRTERTKSCVVTLIGCAINPAVIINSHASLNMPVLLRAEEAWGSLP